MHELSEIYEIMHPDLLNGASRGSDYGGITPACCNFNLDECTVLYRYVHTVHTVEVHIILVLYSDYQYLFPAPRPISDKHMQPLGRDKPASRPMALRPLTEREVFGTTRRTGSSCRKMQSLPDIPIHAEYIQCH